MKKKIILLLAVCLLISLCACGSSQSGSTASVESSSVSEHTTEPTVTASPIAEPSTSESPEPSETTGAVSEGDENASLTVSFEAGGGSGTMNPVNVKINGEYTLPDCVFQAPEGKVFLGWQEDTDTETKQAGTKIQVAKNITLKAVWGSRWAGLQAEINNAKSGAIIKLSGNTASESADSMLTLNKSVTIDLCGFTLDGGKKGPVMEIQEGEVVITDSSSAQTGTITGGASNGAGGAIVVSGTSATLTINGGAITGNSAKTGGAIYNAGTVVLNGGAINKNTASENYGGAIYNQGKFTMNGGSMTDNTCGGDGGAVWSEKEVTLTGGSIRNNQAGANGGGIYLYYGSLTVSGSPVIQDNRAGKNAGTNNVYLAAGVITAGGKLDQNARIGVSSAAVPASGSPVVVTGKLSGNGSAASFFSDNSAYVIGTNNAGEATLSIPSATVSFKNGGGTGNMDAVKVDIGSTYKLPESKFTAPKDQEFSGWKIGETTYQKGDSVKISADTTVTALWKAKAAPASPSPSASPSAEPSPEQSAEPSPEESAEPSPEESAEPSPEQSAEPSPEESAEPAPEESAEPAPEESAEPAPEESAEPSPEPSEYVPATVKITFDAGGGTEKMEPVSLATGSKFKLPECKFAPPKGKAFAGWVIGKPGESPKPDASAKPDIHQAGQTITVDGDTVLKAQWKDDGSEKSPSETGSVFGGGGGIAAGIVVILLVAAAASATVIRKKKV